MKKKPRSCASIQAVKSSQAWRIESVKLSKQLKIVRARSSHKSLHKSSRNEEPEDIRYEEHLRDWIHILERNQNFVICYTNLQSIVKTRNLCVQISGTPGGTVSVLPLISSLLKSTPNQASKIPMAPKKNATNDSTVKYLLISLLPCLHEQILRST